MKRAVKIVSICLAALAAAAALTVLGTNIYVVKSTENKILSLGEVEDEYDCIIVLGAGVLADKSPTAMLEDRLKTAVELYKSGAAPKIIMSGDHGQESYDEVNTMKDYAIACGVPSEDIFMDHAGFSTYETIYRAKEIFGVNKAIIVTQKYHIYRALYIADKLEMETVGVNSNPRKYANQEYRDLREAAARTKDFFKAFFKPEPTFLGETIPVSGNGDATNDKL